MTNRYVIRLAPPARRGTYRVIYKIDEGKHAIEIRTIRHRADAYRT